jgi:hypothetical protein
VNAPIPALDAVSMILPSTAIDSCANMGDIGAKPVAMKPIIILSLFIFVVS